MATGTVTIDLSAPGHGSVQRTTIVRGRQTTRESFDPLPPIPSPQLRPTGVATSGADQPTGATGEPADDPDRQRPPLDTGEDRPGKVRPKIKWIAWGLTLCRRAKVRSWAVSDAPRFVAVSIAKIARSNLASCSAPFLRT